MRLFLIRHGQTPANVLGQLDTAHPGPGPADDPQRTRTHVDWVAEDATAVTFRSTYRVA